MRTTVRAALAAAGFIAVVETAVGADMTGDQGDHFRQDRLLRMRSNVDGRAGTRRDLLRCRWHRPL